jgi:hypothetical protein
MLTFQGLVSRFAEFQDRRVQEIWLHHLQPRLPKPQLEPLSKESRRPVGVEVLRQSLDHA